MIEYFIKRPTPKNGCKSFAVIQRSTDENGATRHETLKHPIIEAINKAFRAKEHDIGYCESQLRGFIEKLRNEHVARYQILNNPENLKILDRFWKDTYESRKKRLVDTKTLYNDYRRAVEALGNLSLLQASTAQIQSTVDSNRTWREQRRVISRLNSILKYCGRVDVQLELMEEEPEDIQYLTEAELEKLNAQEGNPLLILLRRVAFYSGLRLGELFALEPQSFNGKSIYVAWQIKPDLTKTLPKRKKRRRAYIPKKGRAFVKEWCAVDFETKMELRVLEHAKLMKRLSRKAFQKASSKHVDFKALRHSYAVHLLGQNVNLSLVAKSLGNGEEVCRKHYAGFAAVDADIEAMDAIIG